MKKLIRILLSVILVAVLAVLLIPRSSTLYDDGGTKTYNALAYKAVEWNRCTDTADENGSEKEERCHKVSVFRFPSNQKKLDELWEIECQRYGMPCCGDPGAAG